MKYPSVPYSLHRNRGGTFFTMVIFVMMLVSTALMYYYFQRTRSLEQEVSSLRNGGPVESADGGVFSFLPWNREKPAPATTPMPVATAVESAAPPPPAPVEVTNDSLPPSGAASTPRPATGKPDVSAGNDVPAYSDLNLTEEPEQTADILPPTEPEDQELLPTTENSEQVQDDAQENVDPGEVNSMYDAPPQVRVRAPQRD